MHTLLTEARTWLKWAKRRWWVVYLVLLGFSQLVVAISTRETEAGRDWAGAMLIDGQAARTREQWNVPLGASVSDKPAPTTRIAIEVLPPDRERERVLRPYNAQYDSASGDVALPELIGRAGGALVVLLHGSPGSAADFRGLAPFLASAGYSVAAIDLPGYGESSGELPALSIENQAAVIAQLLRTLGARRVHLVGWSLGGGVALHIVDEFERDLDHRIASLTLMASLGVQEAEGSGSFYFEHFKYAVGYGALAVAPELVPHFGVLGPRSARYAFIRNFWDTDQRPLRGIMEHLSVPTLILHGRHDVLVPASAAELHHRLIPTSRLVMLDANHFLPLLQAEVSAKYLIEHFKRHDRPGVAPRRDVLDLAPPVEPRTWLERLLARTEPVLDDTNWPLELVAIAMAMLVSPTLAVVIGGLLVADQQLDWFEALVGLSAGWLFQTVGLYLLARGLGVRAYAIPILGPRLPRISPTDWRRRLGAAPIRAALVDQFVPGRRPFAAWTLGILTGMRGVGGASDGAPSDGGRSTPPLTLGVRSAALFLAFRFLGAVLWSMFSLLVFLGVARPLLNVLSERAGGVGAALGLIGACLIVAGSQLLLTRTGRNHLRARLSRLVRHEFWPAWLFYSPVLVYALFLARKHKGFMLPSCCNPGIEAGGGLIGESKHAIMAALSEGRPPEARDSVLPTFLIPAATSAQGRAAHVEALISQQPEILGYPVVLKPDEGQRGHAVRLMHSRADLLPYFEAMRRPAILQPYHPGPCEAGILWARLPGQPRGHIFSITRKTFPVITGDGKQMLEQLIEAHPRYRCQAGVYLDRFADRASEVLPKGEELRLVVSGNHCQGTLFTDGADLITPALQDAIDALARGFGGAAGGLDFGRFDVRYTSDDDLRTGRGFAVLELNGTFSESTNLYDPGRSLFWAYGVLFRQWRTLYEIGAQRRKTGVSPIGLGRFVSMVREHFRHRDGPALAD